LARKVLDPGDGADGWLHLLGTPARTIIFDSPEYVLTEATAKPWLLGLAEFCELTGRDAIVNLHVAPPPAWAKPAAQGPLFDSVAASPSMERFTFVADLLVEEFHNLGKVPISVDWHLNEIDFALENCQRLEKIVGWALDGRRVRFTLDRLKRAVALAPGVDRRHAAVLLDVSLDLPRFLRMNGVDGDARLLLEKLPSLARMAVRAGVQKRNFLRSRGADHPALARGFLLERARLLVVPAGLDRVVQSLLGQGMAGSKLSLDLGRQIVEVLQHALHTESLATNLEIALDGPAGEFPGFLEPPGMTHLHAAGVLHGITGFGSVAFSGITPAELVTLLPYAWKKTEVVRLGE
jgi:hypothetical protein